MMDTLPKALREVSYPIRVTEREGRGSKDLERRAPLLQVPLQRRPQQRIRCCMRPLSEARPLQGQL